MARVPVAGGPTSLGLERERQRLAYRAQRLAAARAALHDRARGHEDRGRPLPRPLADLSAPIDEVRRRLDTPGARRARRFERGPRPL